MKVAHRVLIGSVGDDSHSVGMKLLEIAFQESDFYVHSLGILNCLDDFFYRADNFDIIFISCMNGHADLYLEDFPTKLATFRLGNGQPKLWYLGGNLSVQTDEEAVIRKYRDLGFDYVSPKPVSFDTVKKQVIRDLNVKKIPMGRVDNCLLIDAYDTLDLESVNDQAMPESQFMQTREKVLSAWPTGSQVWGANVQANHITPSKNLHSLLRKQAAGWHRPLVQPRTGVAHTQDEIEILQYLQKEGLEIASVQLDAASRKCMFAKAEQGVNRSDRGKTSFLNGYPVPVHGVKGVQEIVDSIATPFQIRAGSPDHRFVYEIAAAGGASSLEGGFLCYLMPYDKSTSPIDSLNYWKYLDKLTELYESQYHIVINREYFGPLTCCLIEPSIPICINIVQAVLTAKSGGKCVSVGLAEQGNRSQDIAAVMVLKDLTRHYLIRQGFSDVLVTSVFHQYMAAFPSNEEKSSQLIAASSSTAYLARADRIMTKTPVESVHIPTKEDNVRGLKLTYKGIKQASDTVVDVLRVHQEVALLTREVHALMSVIEELGRGSLARGAMKAFQAGLLDIPFAPSRYNRGCLLTARDCDGAVRFVNPEILPFSEKDKEVHKGNIHRRMVKEGKYNISHILEQDLTRIWNNDYLFWPLDGHYAH